MELHLQRERGGAGSAGKKRMAKSWTAKSFFSGRRDPHSLSGPLAGGQDWVSFGIGSESGSALGAAELLHLALEGFPVVAVFVLLAPFFGVEFDAEPK